MQLGEAIRELEVEPVQWPEPSQEPAVEPEEAPVEQEAER